MVRPRIQGDGVASGRSKLVDVTCGCPLSSLFDGGMHPSHEALRKPLLPRCVWCLSKLARASLEIVSRGEKAACPRSRNAVPAGFGCGSGEASWEMGAVEGGGGYRSTWREGTSRLERASFCLEGLNAHPSSRCTLGTVPSGVSCRGWCVGNERRRG